MYTFRHLSVVILVHLCVEDRCQVGGLGRLLYLGFFEDFSDDVFLLGMIYKIK